MNKPIFAIYLIMALLVAQAEGAKPLKGKGQHQGRGGTTPATSSFSGPDNPSGGGSPSTPPCTHWAAPANGNPAGLAGNPGTSASPFRPQDFWTVSGGPQGKVLCLKNGEYTGLAYLIQPTASGTQANPIWVRAENDGQALVNGQFSNIPILLQNRPWFIIQGINAKNGTYAVIQNRDGSSNNIYRRIVAWDMDIGRNGWIIWNVNDDNVTFEDVAAFGTGNGAFGIGGLGGICRRCWGRGEGSTSNFSHKVVFEPGYDTAVTQCENCFATASTLSMPNSFTVTDANGAAAGVNSNCSPNSGTVSVIQCPGALYRIRSGDSGVASGAKVLGTMVYILASSAWPGFSGRGAVTIPQFGWNLANVQVKHVAAFLSPSASGFSSMRGFEIGIGASSLSSNNVADRLTSLRNVADDWTNNPPRWTVSNTVSGTSFGSISTANPWTGSAGAQFCYQWENGILQDGTGGTTLKKLWPLPMNERIKAATTSAGSYSGPCLGCSGGRAARTETDVMAEIQALLTGQFGDIPAQCKN